MFVCICNGHRESDIREAAAKGLETAHDVYRHLGKPARCGRCLELATKVVDEVRRSLPATQAPVGELCS